MSLGEAFRASHRGQHGQSAVVGLGLTNMRSTAVVAMIGQNALTHRLIDTTVGTLHHALDLPHGLGSRAPFRSRLAPSPPDKKNQSRQQ